MNTRVLAAALVASLVLAACTRSTVLAPVARDPRVDDLTSDNQPLAGQHVVRNGDTLYAVAFRYGLDFRDLAAWNAIVAPYRIVPGQRLRLTRGSAEPAIVQPVAPAARDPVSTPAAKPAPKAADVSSEPASRSAATDGARPLRASWLWPAKGRVSASFARSGKKGIDIAGRAGQPVLAAAHGRVVYSGGGLIGYGELIIIKHNKHYLSAYGHNATLLVKQGEMVQGGQQIAKMGHSGTDAIKLHFEIRRDGKPVDPIRYLPKRVE